MNPLKYTLPQLAKAVVAVVGALVTILGVLVSDLSSGSLHQIGHWASILVPILTAVLVYATKAEQVIDVIDPPLPNAN